MASASALVGSLSSQADEDRGDKWGPFIQPRCRGSPGERGSLALVRAQSEWTTPNVTSLIITALATRWG